MLKTLITGAALGYLGKKLYDEGSLDKYIALGKEKLAEYREKAAAENDIGAPGVHAVPGAPNVGNQATGAAVHH